MADDKFVYEVTIDAATAQAAAKQLRSVFEKELAQAETEAGTRAAASREALAAAKQAAKAQADAAKQAEREVVAAARQAAKEKVAIAKQAAAEAAEAAREAAYAEASAAKQAAREVRAARGELAQAFKREQKEQVAAAKQAAREIAATEQQAAENRLGARLGRGATNLLTLGTGGVGGLAALGLGGMAAYAGVQAGQQLYGMGRDGAEIERTAQLYEAVTARMKVSAGGLVATMQTASRGVLTEAQAQSQGLQILSQKWAGTRTDIVKDAGILTEASRKFSALYPDSEGRAQSPDLVASKLLSYIREGNKELVDQFNISNVNVAAAAGVPNENLTASDRARGLFVLLEEEIARLPDTMNTSIEDIQQAETQFTDAMNRIKQALAAPTAASADFVADILEGAARGNKARDPRARYTTAELRTIGDEAEQMQRTEGVSRANGGPEVQAERLEAYRQAVEAIADAQAKGYGPANAWVDALKEAANWLDTTNEISDENAVAIDLINAAYAEEKGLIDSLSAAHEDMAAAAADEAASIANAEKALADFIVRMGEANVELLALAQQMAAGLQLNVSLNTANPVWRDAAEMAGRTRYVPGTGAVAVSPFAGTTTGETLRALGGNQTGLMANPSAEAYRRDMYDTWDLREENRRANEAAAAQAARAYSSAADKTAKAFEQAAEDAAGAFRDALGKVPGLFGTSSVTAQDMADAEAGVYQPKADEYLRQLRDEVLNGKDYAGVDLADIAGVAGIDQSLSPEAQLRQVERMWDDSSLFANPDALRFVNQDAIKSYQAQEAASAAGKENLYAMFGMGPDSPLTPEQRTAFAEMTGTEGRRIITGADGAAMALTIGGQQRQAASVPAEPEQQPPPPPEPSATSATSAPFLEELLAGLDPSQIAGETLKTLEALGSSIFGAIFTGYESAAGEAEWSDPVVAGLVEQVLPGVLQALEGEI